MDHTQSAFNPDHHLNCIESKVITSLEKLSQVFRVLLWKDAKEEALSPVQLQVLIHLMFQPESLRNITAVARAFNMTKATVSDSVKVLEKKELIKRESRAEDGRSHTIRLTEKGQEAASRVSLFANPLLRPLGELSQEQKEILYQSLLEIIHKLNQAGIIQPLKMCFSCSFFDSEKGHYCKLMQKPLTVFELQVDCREHKAES